MPMSLNAIDGEIIYDTNIDYFIDLYHFDAELVFSFRLPEILFHISDCYCIDIKEDELDEDIFKGCRKVIIAGTRNWISQKEENGKSNINKAKAIINHKPVKAPKWHVWLPKSMRVE